MLLSPSPGSVISYLFGSELQHSRERGVLGHTQPGMNRVGERRTSNDGYEHFEGQFRIRCQRDLECHFRIARGR